MHIGVIGLGSMGGMLARELLRTGAVQPSSLWVANRTAARLDQLASEWPAVHRGTNQEVARKSDVIFLGVHTPDVPAVIEEVRGELRKHQVLVTIANVLPLRTLEEQAGCYVVKVIPSVTQEVGRGVVLVMFSERTSPEARSHLTELLGHIGEVKVIPEELGRICADLTSAGPALIAYVLEEMAAAASVYEPRLPPKPAFEMLVATVAGTAELLREMPPGEVIERVATPGGVTEVGLEVLRRTVPEMWRTMFERMKAREDATRQRLRL